MRGERGREREEGERERTKVNRNEPKYPALCHHHSPLQR